MIYKTSHGVLSFATSIKIINAIAQLKYQETHKPHGGGIHINTKADNI